MLHRMKRKQNIKYYLECVRLRGDNEVQIIMVSKYVGLSLSSNHKSSLHHRIITSIQEQLSRYWWFENSSFNIARKVLRLHAKSMPDMKTFTKVYLYLRIHLLYNQQTIIEKSSRIIIFCMYWFDVFLKTVWLEISSVWICVRVKHFQLFRQRNFSCSTFFTVRSVGSIKASSINGQQKTYDSSNLGSLGNYCCFESIIQPWI